MKRKNIVLRVLMVILWAVILSCISSKGIAAEFVQNGHWEDGESHWVRWDARYEGVWTPTWEVAIDGQDPPVGKVSITTDGSGSVGWYQITTVPPGEYVQLTALWAGELGDEGWAEIYLFTIPETYDHNAIKNRIEEHRPQDIAFAKRDGGIWDWEIANQSPFSGGNGGRIVNHADKVVVALRLGTALLGHSPINVSWDLILLDYDTPGLTSRSFTYQGRLDRAGKPANGLYDMQFRLFGYPTGLESQRGPMISKENTRVIDGYFTVKLDFADLVPNIFDGESRWLDIAVRPGDLEDPNVYIPIIPRQPITPTPYATFAINADILDGQHFSELFSESDDYGRSGVASDLYEGTTMLADIYVNETGDSMSDTLTINTSSDYGLNSTGGTYGVYGHSTETAGSTFGGYFQSDSEYGKGIFARVTNETGINYGGYFYADGDSAKAVFAEAGNLSGVENYGGYFEADGTQARGVYGHATNNDGTTSYGGYFLADGTEGKGVYAEATNNAGTISHGGYFKSDGANGIGVYGEASKWSYDIENYGGYFKAAGEGGNRCLW